MKKYYVILILLCVYFVNSQNYIKYYSLANVAEYDLSNGKYSSAKKTFYY